ncbi:MAG: hypothetical protein DMG57_03940 [Acidobacteria bacterium]|nr:MAG: hypothetical protein DMG57_03940 [Acidobacteriota bacterium]
MIEPLITNHGNESTRDPVRWLHIVSLAEILCRASHHVFRGIGEFAQELAFLQLHVHTGDLVPLLFIQRSMQPLEADVEIIEEVPGWYVKGEPAAYSPRYFRIEACGNQVETLLPD